MNDAGRWRSSTFALAFVLLLVRVAWGMREGRIAQDRERERQQWEGERELSVRLREEQSHEVERLDLAYDELRRERHHASTRPRQRVAVLWKIVIASSGSTPVAADAVHGPAPRSLASSPMAKSRPRLLPLVRLRPTRDA